MVVFAPAAGRPIDFAAYHQRYVALEIAYLGWDHHGFASQADTNNTVEVINSPVPMSCVTICTCLQLAQSVVRCTHATSNTSYALQGHLWAALRRLRLVPDDSDWHVLRYSRCGRTDVGVSAVGQVRYCNHGSMHTNDVQHTFEAFRPWSSPTLG
jgi:tRNA pseudouridine38/39 synthase